LNISLEFIFFHSRKKEKKEKRIPISQFVPSYPGGQLQE